MTDTSPPDLRPFDDLYDDVIAILRSYNAVSIMRACVKGLRDSYEADSIADAKVMPWILLLIIRWAFVHSASPPIIMKEISNSAFIRLYNLVSEMQSHSTDVLKLGNISAVTKFLRLLAHQQFWAQTDVSSIKPFMTRQIILFSEFNNDLEKLTGLTVEKFSQLTFLIWASIGADKGRSSITLNYFNTVKPIYTDNEIELFLNLISNDYNGTKSYIKEKSARDLKQQLLEFTPLWRYPLLKEKNTYTCYSPLLLNYAFSYFIYDYLCQTDKNFGKQDFTRRFGDTFENYIKMGLQQVFAKIIEEDLLKRELQKVLPKGNTPSVVDFALPLKKFNVLIEAKARKVPFDLTVDQSTELLEQQLTGSSNVLKGVEQGFNTVQHIQQHPELFSEINEKIPFFLIIITYKDFHLGPFKEIWDEFLCEALKKRGYLEEVIPKEQILLISIDEFDFLIRLIKNGNLLLDEILEKVATDDRPIGQRNFEFRQYLFEYLPDDKVLPELPYQGRVLEETTQDLVNQLQILKNQG